ncbi:MAG: hypothetical protein GY765_37275 [bacterium]|nr:hypothetical protein [bacterium]
MNKTISVSLLLLLVLTVIPPLAHPQIDGTASDSKTKEPAAVKTSKHGGEGRNDARDKRRKYAFYMAENDLFDGRMLLKIKDRIGLSQKQEQQIEDLVLEFESFSIRNGAEIKIRELRFAAYIKTNRGIDRKKVEQYIRQISEFKTDQIVRYLNYLLDIKGLLDKQQVEKTRGIREKIKAAAAKKRREKRAAQLENRTARQENREEKK